MFALAASLLMKVGLGQKLAKVLGPVILIGLIAGALYWAVSSILDGAYKRGVADTDAAWNQASERLEDQAEVSEDKADANASRRAQDFTNRLAEEKEALDDAVDNGTDPFAGLFP